MDKRILDANIERIRKAAGADADIKIEENKNGGVAIHVELYRKKT